MKLLLAALVMTSIPALSDERPIEIKSITCSSPKEGFKRCKVPGEIVHVFLVDQISEEPCIDESTWGYTEHSIWVSKGCSANFQVSFRKNAHEDADE